MGQDLDYLLKRARECRAAAERAVDPGIRKTHVEFAERYEKEVENLPPDQRRSLNIVRDA